eukprot:jgi/Galph1/3653/GphlegSOOS_G2364.1
MAAFTNSYFLKPPSFERRQLRYCPGSVKCCLLLQHRYKAQLAATGFQWRRNRWCLIHNQIICNLLEETKTKLSTDCIPHSSIASAAASLYSLFYERDQITKENLSRVIEIFREKRVTPSLFWSANGYGHSDLARDALDQVYASLFGCESALVRLQFLSGTHAIACCLYGNLRPGDEWVSLTGPPYDTLEEVWKFDGFNISYRELPLTKENDIDLEAIPHVLSTRTKLVYFQRSCGYAWRKSFSVAQLARAITRVKNFRPDIICFVDNCYGEFVETIEPTHVGADLVAGSLIKNFGGTIVPSGGYIAGKRELVERASYRLGAPGIEGGATFDQHRILFQGLFLSPSFVGESVKGACLVAQVMKDLGFKVHPEPLDQRTDIIQSVCLGSAELLLAFCQSVQRLSPVNAFVEPIAGNTPGYGEQVVFANGTFIDGSTSELSADGPLKSPYCVYTQGGTSWTHWQLVLEAFITRYSQLENDE